MTLDITGFLGRFHPVILHLPIGFLLLSVIMDVYRRRRGEPWQGAVRAGLLLSALSAVLTALFGMFLSWESGYDAQALSWHKWTGIATAVLSVGLYLFYYQSWYPWLAGLTTTVLLWAGHLGGQLTHGNYFLTEKAPAWVRNITGTPEPEPEIQPLSAEAMYNAVAFDHLIQPILKKKCFSCHNPDKAKGDLLLHNRASIEKGGKNGDLFVPGDAHKSLLYKRLLLPLDEKEHMPPKGKMQLTREEITLLEWWIDQGADFEKLIGDCEQPEEIQAILEAKTASKRPALPPIAALSDRKLKKLQSKGLKILPVAQGQPWLSADLSGSPASALKGLKPAAGHVVDLNLKGAGLENSDLRFLSSFTNLQRLSLQNCDISDESLAHLEDLPFLYSLNLVATKVTDAVLERLKTFPRLESVYLWQTQVSTAAAAQWQQANPAVVLNLGYETDSTFSAVKLRPPVLLANKDLFEDSLTVEIKMNFSGIKVYYTLDGSMPDSTALLYENPILLTNSTLLRAVTVKPGWLSSDPVERFFSKLKYKPSLVQATRPHEKYDGKGTGELVNATRGGANFRDEGWLGWEGTDLTAVLDLGQAQPVARISMGAHENTGAWIFFPKGISIWASADGRKYEKVQTTEWPEAAAPTNPGTRVFTTSFEPVQARFLKLQVNSVGRNPAWHPAAGEPCWLFLDEIMVD